jgi:hypothetical protein
MAELSSNAISSMMYQKTFGIKALITVLSGCSFDICCGFIIKLLNCLDAIIGQKEVGGCGFLEGIMVQDTLGKCDRCMKNLLLQLGWATPNSTIDRVEWID